MSEVCQWAPDDELGYETSCGQAFILIDDTPEENHMKFCCYCGKPLMVMPPPEDTFAQEDTE